MALAAATLRNITVLIHLDWGMDLFTLTIETCASVLVKQEQLPEAIACV